MDNLRDKIEFNGTIKNKPVKVIYEDGTEKILKNETYFFTIKEKEDNKDAYFNNSINLAIKKKSECKSLIAQLKFNYEIYNIMITENIEIEEAMKIYLNKEGENIVN